MFRPGGTPFIPSFFIRLTHLEINSDVSFTIILTIYKIVLRRRVNRAISVITFSPMIRRYVIIIMFVCMHSRIRTNWLTIVNQILINKCKVCSKSLFTLLKLLKKIVFFFYFSQFKHFLLTFFGSRLLYGCINYCFILVFSHKKKIKLKQWLNRKYFLILFLVFLPFFYLIYSFIIT